jgi:hypothetical protein
MINNLEKNNKLGEVLDTLEVRVELSFYRHLVTYAWLAEQILNVGEGLVIGM